MRVYNAARWALGTTLHPLITVLGASGGQAWVRTAYFGCDSGSSTIAQTFWLQRTNANGVTPTDRSEKDNTRSPAKVSTGATWGTAQTYQGNPLVIIASGDRRVLSRTWRPARPYAGIVLTDVEEIGEDSNTAGNNSNVCHMAWSEGPPDLGREIRRRARKDYYHWMSAYSLGGRTDVITRGRGVIQNWCAYLPRPNRKPPNRLVLPVTADVVINVDVAGAITFTGQQVGLKTSIAVTAGAVALTGQAIGLQTTVAPTAGAITLTGQALGLKTTVAVTAGAVLWTGQAVGLTTSIAVTPGAVLWTGANDITLVVSGGTTIVVTVPGAITLTGQQVGLTTSIAVAAGATIWTGQTLGLKTSVSPVAGALTWAGQVLALKTTIGVAPGAVLWTGATNIVLVSGGNVVVNVDVAGQVSWAGQAVGLKLTIVLTPGAIAWAGQTVGAVHSFPLVAGAISWSGQAVALRQALVLLAGQITWAGQVVGITTSSDGKPVADPQSLLDPLEGDDVLASSPGDAVLSSAPGDDVQGSDRGEAGLSYAPGEAILQPGDG